MTTCLMLVGVICSQFAGTSRIHLIHTKYMTHNNGWFFWDMQPLPNKGISYPLWSCWPIVSLRISTICVDPTNNTPSNRTQNTKLLPYSLQHKVGQSQLRHCVDIGFGKMFFRFIKPPVINTVDYIGLPKHFYFKISPTVISDRLTYTLLTHNQVIQVSYSF